MAAAKAEMQLMSPLQISDPFGSFPHSPTMDNYPKLEEMMLLSNGAPQFLGAAGAPEGSSGSSSSMTSCLPQNPGSHVIMPYGHPCRCAEPCFSSTFLLPSHQGLHC